MKKSALEEAREFTEAAPGLSDGEMEGINNLFTAYLFRRTKTGEIWTTCCHEHIVVPDAGGSAELRRAMWEPHQRQPRHAAARPPAPQISCPFCGKPVIVKEMRYTGNRKNLGRWKRAVVLRYQDGALWARAYDCCKGYERMDLLTDDPDCKLIGVYRFRPGIAECSNRQHWGYPFYGVQRQTGKLTNGKWNICEPYYANAEYGISYDVVGMDEIQESPFRYCMSAAYEKNHLYFMRFLTACCFYPRQIEMLMKAGMDSVVYDLVGRGVKNAIAINWDEENPAKAFGLNKQEMREFMATSRRDIDAIALYKRFKKRVPLTEVCQWIENMANVRETIHQAKVWNIPPEKLFRYFESQCGCGRYGGFSAQDTVLRCWKDYLTAAQALNYPLHRDNVLLPKQLGAEHDKASAEHRKILERERERERRIAAAAQQKRLAEERRLAEIQYAERKETLEKKYGYAADGYLIRIPSCFDEIVKEGAALKHCVAGYADRHIRGVVTILFMRKEKSPNKPWITIEMNGDSLVQIHGFKNEGIHTATGRFAPDPREEYRAFLDPWLDWVQHGSKRNKAGEPIMPKRRKEEIRIA